MSPATWFESIVPRNRGRATPSLTKRYGNLRRDGVDEVLERALIDGENILDELCFTQEQLLPVQELAARFGDPQSQRIHEDPASIRHWWLECTRRAGPVKK